MRRCGIWTLTQLNFSNLSLFLIIITQTLSCFKLILDFAQTTEIVDSWLILFRFWNKFSFELIKQLTLHVWYLDKKNLGSTAQIVKIFLGINLVVFGVSDAPNRMAVDFRLQFQIYNSKAAWRFLKFLSRIGRCLLDKPKFIDKPIAFRRQSSCIWWRFILNRLNYNCLIFAKRPGGSLKCGDTTVQTQWLYKHRFPVVISDL